MGALYEMLQQRVTQSPQRGFEGETRLQTLSRAVAKTEATIAGLLRVEADARDALKRQLESFRTELRQLSAERDEALRLERVRARQARFGQRFHRLSLEPLRWRDGEGLPRLVIFSLSEPLFKVTSRALHRPVLPGILHECYRDVVEMLRRKAPEDTYLSLSCRFSGFIPQRVKERLPAAEKDFNGELFLIAEPAGWSLTEHDIPAIERDPLLVGFAADALWLITDFETTEIEDRMFFT